MHNSLERSMSLAGAVALIVGFVIGGSLFVMTPTLAGMTGPSLYLAYAVSAIPATFAAMYLIQLGGALPVTGANYIAISRWISPMAGFTTSAAVIIGAVCTNCLVAWGMAQYIISYIHGLPVMPTAIAIIILFGLVNWLGIKFFERVQILMLILFLLAMILFSSVGIFNINPAYQTPLFPNGLGSFFMVAALAAFSWAGVIAIVEVAGEVKNPRRNIPLSIVIAMVIIAVMYFTFNYVYTGTLLWSESSKIGSTAVLKAAGSFLPAWGVNFIALGALLAMATTLNSLILMSARDVLAWGNDLVFPKVFQRIHPRFQTPEISVLFITIISLVGVLFAARIEKYALMVIFGLMVVQFLGATAVLRLPKTAPEIYNKSALKFSPFFRWFTWVGCVISFTGVFLFGILADYKTFLVFLGLLVIALIYWFFRKNQLQRQGINLEEKLREITHHQIFD